MANPKRPRDFMQLAKTVVDIATGETHKKPASKKRGSITSKTTKTRSGSK